MSCIQFWAKLDQQTGQGFHPLLWHMVDVACCARLLVEQTSKQVQSLVMLESSNCNDVSIIAWLVGLHDLGKCSPFFQAISDNHKNRLADLGLSFPIISERVRHIRHDAISAFRIREILLGLGVDLTRAQTLSRIVSGHHGLFPTTDELDIRQAASDEIWSNQCLIQANALASILEIQTDEIAAFFSNWPIISPRHEAILAGLTTHSDWLGSQSDYFPFANDIESPKDYLETSTQQAILAVSSVRERYSKSEQPTIKSFGTLFPNKIARPLQKAVISFASGQSETYLLIVEAPMGEGKTEAAMWAAHHAQNKFGSAGTYFALPTEATSNQMFVRVKAYLESIGESVELHLAHGHADFVDEYAQLVSFTNVYDSDSIRSTSISASEWFCKPKRRLLADHGVGTVDQALISILQTKHFFLRLYGLCGKTVIIDEVHAYDDYTECLLELLLNWLSAMGCCVIILSATLPCERRSKLLSAYAGRTFEQADVPYPRISWVTSSAIGAKSFAPSEEQRRTVSMMWIADDPETLAQQAVELVSEGGRIAVICNTVSRAQKVCNIICTQFPDQEVYLLHARFTIDARQTKEKTCMSRFGREGADLNNSPAILIGTQVLEQSLDLDFDVMISDLAPVDLLLQRMGRLHRHKRNRPLSHREPRFFIASGSELVEKIKVYDHYLLSATLKILSDYPRLCLPDDIETLIEAVYCDDESQIPPDLQSEYQKLQAKRAERRDNAKRCQILRANRSDAHLWEEWTTSGLAEDEPGLNRHLQALTRSFEPSITAVCLEEGEPVGAMNHEQIKALLLQSVRISHRGLINSPNLMETPTEWKARAVLRNMKLLRFTEGVCEIGDWRIINDPMLGLVIESKKGEETE